jgi:hypothetical protein
VLLWAWLNATRRTHASGWSSVAIRFQWKEALAKASWSANTWPTTRR